MRQTISSALKSWGYIHFYNHTGGPLKLFAKNPLSLAWCVTLTGVYAVIVFTGILHHELWFDECQTYLYARSSCSLSQLIYNCRFEGQPLLWHLLLYFITRFSGNPLWMQVMNAVLSCAAAWLFLRYSPFSLPFKILFITGYFMIYEYSVISRAYALGCFWLFAVLSLKGIEKQYFILTLLSLLFLANSQTFFGILCMALAVQIVAKYFLNKEQFERNGKYVMLMVVGAMAAIIIALWQALPSPDFYKIFHASQPFFSVEQMRKVRATPFRGIFNLPDFTTYYSWNTNLFTDHFWRFDKLFLPLPAVLGFALLYRKPASLLFFFLATAAIMMAEYVGLSTASRHAGIIYLSLIAALWLSYYEAETIWVPGKWLNNLLSKSETLAQFSIWLILVLQVMAGCILYVKDIRQTFSESREVSNYLQQNSLTGGFIMVSNQSKGPPLSAYLNRPVFYTEAGRSGTFCYWDVTPWIISDSAILERVNEQLLVRDSLFLLMGHPLKTSDNMVLLRSFDQAFVKGEDYYVYSVKRKK